MASSVNRIKNEKGETLFLLRKKKPFGWGLPGGKMDEGETPEQTCIRETFEETGIVVTSCQFIGIEKSVNGLDVHIFETILDYTPEVKKSPQEHLSFRWINTHYDEYANHYNPEIHNLAFAGYTLNFIDCGKKYYIPEGIAFSGIDRLYEEVINKQKNKDL